MCLWVAFLTVSTVVPMDYYIDVIEVKPTAVVRPLAPPHVVVV